MSKGWTKERVLFFVAAALFLLVMIKLGLVLSDRSAAPGAPATGPVAAHQGDADLNLAPGDLASLQQRGNRPLPGPPPKMPRPHPKGPELEDGEREKEVENKGGNKGGDVEQKDTERDDRDKRGFTTDEAKPTDIKGKLETLVRPPFTLVAIVHIEGQPNLQAVLRHEPTGKLHRLSLGDRVEGLLLEEVWDDGVVLRDAAGRRHAYGDRFAATHGR